MAPRQCSVCNETCVGAGAGHWERLYSRESGRAPTVARACDGCGEFLCGGAPACALAACGACRNVFCRGCYGAAAAAAGHGECAQCAACDAVCG